jgi:hypothetical protein
MVAIGQHTFRSTAPGESLWQLRLSGPQDLSPDCTPAPCSSLGFLRPPSDLWRGAGRTCLASSRGFTPRRQNESAAVPGRADEAAGRDPGRLPMDMSATACACGSGGSYEDCCFPLHAGSSRADAPLALLRSRCVCPGPTQDGNVEAHISPAATRHLHITCPITSSKRRIRKVQPSRSWADNLTCVN